MNTKTKRLIQAYNNQTARTENVWLILSTGIAIGVAAVIILSLVTMNLQDIKHDQNKIEFEQRIDQLSSEYVAEVDALNEQHDAVVKNLQSELDAYRIMYEALQENLVNPQSYEEAVDVALMQKYSYCINRINPEQGFTLGMLKYIDELAKDSDINPHMITAIIDIESDYNTKARSQKSTATGLGQILKGTGEICWYTFLGNPEGSYDHETIANDGYLNIRMMVSYVKYLKDTYKSINVMINGYSGDQTGAYYSNWVAQMKAYGQDPTINHYI